MKDTAIKNTGNSRFLRANVAPDITFAEFIALLIAGQLPIDLAGVNMAGIDILGTALSKANLLKDETASAYGLDGDATPNDVFNALIRVNKKIGNDFLWLGPDGYVNSPDPNAYSAAAGYTKLGKIGERARIATGSYKGTDKSGQSNPVSLTFDFTPKLVVVYGGSLSGRMGVFVYGTPTVAGATDSSALGALQVSWLANGISWYSTVEDNAANQYNDPYTYYYIAIG